MLRQGKGHIVDVSSAYGEVGRPQRGGVCRQQTPSKAFAEVSGRRTARHRHSVWSIVGLVPVEAECSTALRNEGSGQISSSAKHDSKRIGTPEIAEVPVHDWL